MILTPTTTRMSTADPAPAVVAFEAVSDCGCVVWWRQTYGCEPIPGACEKPACSAGETDTMVGAPGDRGNGLPRRLASTTRPTERN